MTLLWPVAQDEGVSAILPLHPKAAGPIATQLRTLLDERCFLRADFDAYLTLPMRNHPKRVAF